ncbi:DUF6894 family protein [Bradyrhizobium sp. sGM-13]|uniref:DUF6894 family protein n=1 Tax=Bradyrhizobium sp. sGM-13 TaxID=2831781 RepID=UPI001BD18703|nr:hypothetical protein [Bradyrhizobium sp. sGM-13]
MFLVSEGDDFFPDEEGLELSTVEAVLEEAAWYLADIARLGVIAAMVRATARQSVWVPQKIRLDT